MSPLHFFHTYFRSRRAALLLVLALCALLVVSFPSEANSRNDREQRAQPERRDQARARISASQAAALVQRQYGGKVMNVQTRNSNGGVIYSVKILSSSGHMRTVNVDGQSGSILN